MWLSSLAKRYDAFARSKDHVQVRTLSGGVVSTVAIALTVVLLVSEFSYFRSTRLEEHLLIDKSQGERDCEISLELDLLGVSCRHAELRVEDSRGQAYGDARVHVHKLPILADGRIAMGAGVAPEAAPGCKLKGGLTVRKVAGNFHVAAGHAAGGGDGHFAFSVSPLDFASYNASHIVRHLDFGPAIPNGQWAPLDGTVAVATRAGTQFQYHLKAVPTIYEHLSGEYAAGGEGSGGAAVRWRWSRCQVCVRKGGES